MTSLRTLLFAPANHPRRVEKSFTLGADAVILDLEDACAISEKVASRTKVVEAMQHPRSCLGYVRVNPLSTEFAYGDLTTVIRSGLDGVVLPKVETPGDLITADWLIGQLEHEHHLTPGSVDLIPIIETGLGVAQLEKILHAPCCHGGRVKRVAFGAGDFTLDMGLTWNADEAELLMYRAAIVLASRACGLEPPIDTVWVDLQNADGFKASAARARHLGFQGKLCIYPAQVAIVNTEFTPSEAEVERAHRIIDAFAEAEAQGSSSIQLDGQFIDYPIVYRAQRVLAMVANLNSAASRAAIATEIV